MQKTRAPPILSFVPLVSLKAFNVNDAECDDIDGQRDRQGTKKNKKVTRDREIPTELNC